MIGEKASDMIKSSWSSKRQEYRRPVIVSKKKPAKIRISKPITIKKKWIKERLSLTVRPGKKKTSSKKHGKRNRFFLETFKRYF